jgi:CheY-like chemotaxis protein
MNAVPGNKVLFVDDEPCMREIMAMLLNEEGYEVFTASDGLDALVQLRSSTPDLIISDLSMPRMSGQELLSVVRRRFPAIPVIAISESYEIRGSLPPGVMADTFYPKGRCNPDELLRTVADLISNPVTRSTHDPQCHPPAAQLARASSDSTGGALQRLTCSDCLREFSLDTSRGNRGKQEALCPFCDAPVSFVTDASLEHASRTMLDVWTPANSSTN